MNPDEHCMELAVLSFLSTCSVDDYVTLYEYMHCVKLEMVETETLELKYVITQTEDGPADIGQEVSFDELTDLEKFLAMTDYDLEILYEKVLNLG